MPPPAAGELLDPTARDRLKRRLEDLRDALDEAQRFNDPERAERAEREIEFLTDELARAVGLEAGAASPRRRPSVRAST